MRDLREFALRLAAGLGLGVSLALLWEYTRGGPALCTPGGGCDAVRESAYASVAGIPTPLFGVVFFAAALLLATFSGPRARSLLALVTAVGAAVSVALFALQAVAIGAFCIACVLADAAALAMFPLALFARRDADYPTPRRSAATAVALVVAALPFAYGLTQPGAAEPQGPDEALVQKLPPVVADAQVEGKVTIVEFIDYGCPHCQELHHRLSEILPDYEDQVAVERVHLPNPKSEIAGLAARTAICAENQGLGDDVADELMNARQLGPQNVMAIARRVGLSQNELSSCATSEETSAQLEENFEVARDIEIQGLPTFFIGRERHRGTLGEEQLRASIDRALERGERDL